MGKKYCLQLGNIPDEKKRYDTDERFELYKCNITGGRCTGAKFEDPDPGYPGSMCEASYDDGKAACCPAYDVPDILALSIRKSILERKAKGKETEASALRNKAAEIGMEIMKHGESAVEK